MYRLKAVIERHQCNGSKEVGSWMRNIELQFLRSDNANRHVEVKPHTHFLTSTLDEGEGISLSADVGRFVGYLTTCSNVQRCLSILWAERMILCCELEKKTCGIIGRGLFQCTLTENWRGTTKSFCISSFLCCYLRSFTAPVSKMYISVASTSFWEAL
jgi:hypothetical protein